MVRITRHKYVHVQTMARLIKLSYVIGDYKGIREARANSFNLYDASNLM